MPNHDFPIGLCDDKIEMGGNGLVVKCSQERLSRRKHRRGGKGFDRRKGEKSLFDLDANRLM